jgi:hypothetical protein
MIKELNGIGSGFIVIDFKIKHSGGGLRLQILP